MAAMNYKVGTNRGANAVEANPQRLTSADGRKWALGRNVKGESARGPGYYEVVEVWTLKQRDSRGAAVTVRTHCDIDEARAWVAGGAA